MAARTSRTGPFAERDRILGIPDAVVRRSGAALEKPVRIGVLTPAWGPPGALGGLVEGLIDLSYRENEDFVIGVRLRRVT